MIRQALAVAHVALESGAMAVEEHHHDGGAGGIEALRNVQQHAVVAKGFRFQEHAAAEIDVAARIRLAGVEERPVRAGHRAAIGERRGLEVDKAGLGLEVGR